MERSPLVANANPKLLDMARRLPDSLVRYAGRVTLVELRHRDVAQVAAKPKAVLDGFDGQRAELEAELRTLESLRAASAAAVLLGERDEREDDQLRFRQP